MYAKVSASDSDEGPAHRVPFCCSWHPVCEGEHVIQKKYRCHFIDHFHLGEDWFVEWPVCEQIDDHGQAAEELYGKLAPQEVLHEYCSYYEKDSSEDKEEREEEATYSFILLDV